MSQRRRQCFLCFLQGDAEGSPWEKQLAGEQEGQSRDASSKLQTRERAGRTAAHRGRGSNSSEK